MQLNDEAKLRCPKCGNTDKFSIVSEVWVHVRGSDYTDVIDEDGDREYGSESPCRCGGCGHQAPMGDFYDEKS